jgi:hypothetical protein
MISSAVANTGYYQGNFPFINDENAAEPSGFTSNNGAGCTTLVVATIDGHNKVLDCHDQNLGNVCDILFSPLTDMANGTIEFWWRTDDNTKTSQVYLYDGATQCIRLLILAGTFQYDNGSVQDTTIVPANDTWYRHTIQFECAAGAHEGLAADTFNWLIDSGVTYNGQDLGFKNGGDDIDSVRIFTDGTSQNFHAYFDSFGVVGDKGYSEGDNNTLYTSVVFRHALARRGTHENHQDYSAFDIAKMIFPDASP